VWSVTGTPFDSVTAATNAGDTTSVEYPFGSSLVFKRLVFLTPALCVGKRTDIIGGFRQTEPKPADLQSVPT
jgi:hypothetical protein